MADNTQLGAADPAGAIAATDDIGGVHFQRIKLIHGADGTNDGDVADGNPFPVKGTATNPTGNFTRPADTTAYASGDLVANSTTAGSCTSVSLTVARAAAGSFMLRRLKLHKSGTSVTNASFRVHLFRSTVTFANGDNAAFSVSGVADYLGAFDVTIDRAFTDGAAGFGIPVVGSDVTVKLASGTTIRAVIEARLAYTPASAEVFTITLDDLQN